MLKVYPDLEEVSRNTARILIEAAQSAVNKRGGFSLLLSGGNTPRRLFGLLAESPYREQVPWGKTHVFWGDERCVPADDERNNAYMARQILLERVPIPEEQIHPVASTLPPMKAAEKYQNTLREYFSGHPPIFDFILLGLVSEVYGPSLHMWRVTLTAPILNQARKIVFLVSGASKAWVLNQVLNGPHNPQQLPAQLIKPQDGQLLWLADKAAASQIQASSMKKSTD
jgi:6-phosphogluconolactonase